MAKRTTTWVGVAAALASLAAGCGGGSTDTGGDSANEGPKAAFVKQADSICAESLKQTQKEYEAYAKKINIPLTQEPTAAQYATVAKTILVPSLQRQVEEIRALDVPAVDKAQIDEFLRLVEDAIETAEKSPVAAAKSPTNLLAAADKAVRNYGFKVCAQPQ